VALSEQLTIFLAALPAHLLSPGDKPESTLVSSLVIKT
jgi:hypothetical protein